MMQQNDVFCAKIAQGASPDGVFADMSSSLEWKSDIVEGDVVLIKSNFVSPHRHATTDLHIIDFFVREIRAIGAEPVIGESSGSEFDTTSTFRVLGVDEYAKENRVRLVDFEKDGFIEQDWGRGIGRVEIAEVVMDAKCIINLPVLKGHTITKVTAATKNLFGLFARQTRRQLHAHGLNASIKALGQKMQHTIHFVDARRIMSRAVFAEPSFRGVLLAGRNPFTLDHLGAQLLSVVPSSVGYLDEIPPYEMHGATIELPNTLSKKASAKERVHRGIYAAFYLFDHLKANFAGGKTILYDLHWYLGVHPELLPMSKERLKLVAESCPVDAIDMNSGKIVKNICAKVRCLQCYRDHPNWTVLGGLNRPRLYSKRRRYA